MWSPEVTTEVTEQHNTTLSLPALWCLVQLKICQVSLLVSGTELFIFRSGVFLQQFLEETWGFFWRFCCNLNSLLSREA